MLPLGFIAFGQGGGCESLLPKNSLDFGKHPSRLCVLFSMKPRKQKVWEWGGDNRCSNWEQSSVWHVDRERWIMNVRVEGGVRSWHRGQRFGRLCLPLLQILNICQCVFRRNLLSLEGWLFPSTQTGCWICNIYCSQGWSRVSLCRTWCCCTSWSNSSQWVQQGGHRQRIPSWF